MLTHRSTVIDNITYEHVHPNFIKMQPTGNKQIQKEEITHE